MHLNPILTRGPANRESLRSLMATAKRDHLFSEVEFTGPGASTLVFVAGRVAHGRLRGHDRPVAAQHTASTLHDHNVEVLAGVLRSQGCFYRCHPLAGVQPTAMPFTYDALELLDAAVAAAGSTDAAVAEVAPPRTAIDVASLTARAASLRAELQAEREGRETGPHALHARAGGTVTRRGALARLIRSLAD